MSKGTLASNSKRKEKHFSLIITYFNQSQHRDEYRSLWFSCFTNKIKNEMPLLTLKNYKNPEDIFHVKWLLKLSFTVMYFSLF